MSARNSLKRTADYAFPFAPYSRPMKRYRYNQAPRTRRNTSRYYSNSYRSRSGPYRALTSSGRHTHPTYPRPEVKYFDQFQNGTYSNTTGAPPATSITDSGLVYVLNDLTVVNANAFGGVIGNQVSIKSCSYRFEVALPAAMDSAPVPTSGRVVLVWDKQPNSQPASFNQIFDALNYLAFKNMAYRDRFVILRNQQFSLSPNGDETLFFEGYCPINMQSTYQIATSSTVNSVPYTGALLLAYISDQANSINQPTLTGVWRTRYIDN